MSVNSQHVIKLSSMRCSSLTAKSSSRRKRDLTLLKCSRKLRLSFWPEAPRTRNPKILKKMKTKRKTMRRRMSRWT